MANLDPCAAESQILLIPPHFVHIGLILKRQVQVLPVHYYIELIIGPLFLPTCSQVLMCDLFAGMESEGLQDISCDFTPPYYQRHIFYEQ